MDNLWLKMASCDRDWRPKQSACSTKECTIKWEDTFKRPGLPPSPDGQTDLGFHLFRFIFTMFCPKHFVQTAKIFEERDSNVQMWIQYKMSLIFVYFSAVSNFCEGMGCKQLPEQQIPRLASYLYRTQKIKPKKSFYVWLWTSHFSVSSCW